MPNSTIFPESHRICYNFKYDPVSKFTKDEFEKFVNVIKQFEIPYPNFIILKGTAILLTKNKIRGAYQSGLYSNERDFWMTYHALGDNIKYYDNDKMEITFKYGYFWSVVKNIMFDSFTKDEKIKEYVDNFFDFLKETKEGKNIIELGIIYQRVKVIEEKFMNKKEDINQFGVTCRFMNILDDVSRYLLNIATHNYKNNNYLFYIPEFKLKFQFDSEDLFLIKIFRRHLQKNNTYDLFDKIFKDLENMIKIGNLIIEEYMNYAEK